MTQRSQLENDVDQLDKNAQYACRGGGRGKFENAEGDFPQCLQRFMLLPNDQTTDQCTNAVDAASKPNISMNMLFKNVCGLISGDRVAELLYEISDVDWHIVMLHEMRRAEQTHILPPLVDMFSQDLVDQMVESGEEPSLGGQETKITAFFSDVQAFSSFSPATSSAGICMPTRPSSSRPSSTSCRLNPSRIASHSIGGYTCEAFATAP